MASVAAAQRPGAARAAAKQRRQVILLIVLLAVLAALLAFVLPRLMNRSESSGRASAAAPAATAALLNRLAKKGHAPAGADPFRGNPLPNQDARAVTSGGRDPFKGGPALIVSPRVIPGQIVIGRPGPHRVATHGWIVILASIPTRHGHASAVHFARGARTRVGSLSVLNSSNRRPLRGGYWVVYAGPYPTQSVASRRAGSIHAAGYGSAYLRELITYK